MLLEDSLYNMIDTVLLDLKNNIFIIILYFDNLDLYTHKLVVFVPIFHSYIMILSINIYIHMPCDY